MCKIRLQYIKYILLAYCCQVPFCERYRYLFLAKQIGYVYIVQHITFIYKQNSLICDREKKEKTVYFLNTHILDIDIVE